MERDQALRILAAHHDEIATLVVKFLGIFVSVARNEAGLDSDVGVLVEFDRPIGILGFSTSKSIWRGSSGRRWPW